MSAACGRGAAVAEPERHGAGGVAGGVASGVAGGIGPPLRLHLPDEPVGRRQAWRSAVLDGGDLREVVGGPDGVARWLWSRWSVLGTVGMEADALSAVATAYRREIWLWLVGDRAWDQCCAGLIGRIGRRLRS